ncbi:MAG: ribonuclease P protein component [Prolixibacteraceae bacterium]|nr:ribonuclease P protein component [Prolixibacteraceae bacterium]
MSMRNTFNKSERLCSMTEIEQLFARGQTLFEFPVKVIYRLTDDDSKVPAKVVFAVPKRRFKHAVDRNLIRRRMREAYRLNKHEFLEQLSGRQQTISLMFLYAGQEIKDYQVIEKGLIKGMNKLLKKLAL